MKRRARRLEWFANFGARAVDDGFADVQRIFADHGTTNAYKKS